MTLRTDTPVADFDEVGRWAVVATDVTLPGHADHLRQRGQIHAGMSWACTCSFATPWTGQRGGSSRSESGHGPVTPNTP